MRYPEIYQQLGVTPPRGFLLHGPPGCGKTLMANAIAGVSMYACLVYRGSSIVKLYTLPAYTCKQ